MKQIRSMSFEELIRVRADIDAAIELHMARERQAMMKMLQKAGSGGGPVRSETTGAHPLKGKKLAPKFRNPTDRTQVWAGRGNKPRWLAAALKAGKKLESFAVR
jgi:DNA-binding protein H-NS